MSSLRRSHKEDGRMHSQSVVDFAGSPVTATFGEIDYVTMDRCIRVEATLRLDVAGFGTQELLNKGFLCQAFNGDHR